jgi:hypothetical protein
MATGTSRNPTGPASAQPDAPPLAAARRHRLALLHAIQSFERALAVPAGNPGWCDGVTGRLGSLRAAFAEHVVVTEGSDGLYAELLDHAPRLARGVDVLIREHAALAAAMDALQRQVAAGPAAIEEVRGWASDLLREMSRHRQRGADLVYEAYAMDIGGET